MCPSPRQESRGPCSAHSFHDPTDPVTQACTTSEDRGQRPPWASLPGPPPLLLPPCGVAIRRSPVGSSPSFCLCLCVSVCVVTPFRPTTHVAASSVLTFVQALGWGWGTQQGLRPSYGEIDKVGDSPRSGRPALWRGRGRAAVGPDKDWRAGEPLWAGDEGNGLELPTSQASPHGREAAQLTASAQPRGHTPGGRSRPREHPEEDLGSGDQCPSPQWPERQELSGRRP